MKKTSKEWMIYHEIPEYAIIDPDGWDRTNLEYSFNEELITEEEFINRIGASTCYLGLLEKIIHVKPHSTK